LQGKYIESRIQKLFAKVPTLNREDLRQSAQEGLIEAIHSFDLSKGFRLITWAWYRISSKFKQQVTAEVTQSKAENCAKIQTPLAQDNPQIDVLQLDSVKKVIAKFKQPIKKIIELRTQGYEFPEIGKLLGKTADACRMGYNRAIQRIRQILLPSETIHPVTPTTRWMKRLKLRFGKNVRFGHGDRHNTYRVQRRTMSKRIEQAALIVCGLISASIVCFSIASVGRTPECQTQIYNIGLPIFTFLILCIPFTTGYTARGVIGKSKKPNPRPRRSKSIDLK
jgi:RNA polymerase sigma factor (sigma-70 family)